MRAGSEPVAYVPRAGQLTGEDALLRLAHWLAEVSAEAALAATQPTNRSTFGTQAWAQARDDEDGPVPGPPR